MSQMSIKDYQQTVDEWVKTYGVRYFSELTNLGILVEEVGEVARIMTRTYGEQSFKEEKAKHDLGDELADVLFGKRKAMGKLPFELPSSQEAVEKQMEDLPYDSENPLYPFGYGLSF